MTGKWVSGSCWGSKDILTQHSSAGTAPEGVSSLSLGGFKSGSSLVEEHQGSEVREGWGVLGKFYNLCVPQFLHAENEDGNEICFSKVRNEIVATKPHTGPRT